jgi:hypothetical protein
MMKNKILLRTKSLFFSAWCAFDENNIFENTKTLMQYCQNDVDRIFNVIFVMIKTGRENRR